MSRAAWRTWQAETVDRLTALLGVVRAFALVGRSRATHHRQANPRNRQILWIKVCQATSDTGVSGDGSG
ncbi:hypothetical protein ACMHYT_29765, partial [Rhodococcus qingshengii]